MVAFKQRASRKPGRGPGRGPGGGRRRLQVALLAAGAVLVLGAGVALEGGGVGVARAGEPAGRGRESASTEGLFTPRIDPATTRRAAVDYLVSQGVPRGQAGTRIDRQAGQVRAAVALRRRSPQGVRSVWISDTGKLMAAVLNADGRQAALAAGATPVAAPKPGVDLEAIRDKLATQTKDNPPPGFDGATFEIDPAQGKVIAHYLFTDNPRVPAAVKQFGDVVTASAERGGLQALEEVNVAGTTMTKSVGPNDSRTCTAAWAVDIDDPNGGTAGNGVMTAGHCLIAGDDQTVYEIDTAAAGNTRATREFYSFGPAGDYGYLRLQRDRGSTSTANFDVIASVREPVTGATVCKLGASTGETCGTILRTGVTTLQVYQGVVYLLLKQVRANLLSALGDSGAPVYMDAPDRATPLGVAALGILGSRTVARGREVAYFTALSEIDNRNRYYVRIAGG